jgi:hypothetical protein
MRLSIFVLWGFGVLLATGVASAAGYGGYSAYLPLHLPAPFGALAWAGLGLGSVALFAARRDPEAAAG